TVARVGKTLHKWVIRTNERSTVNIEASSIKKFDVEAGITANDIQSAERALLQQIHKGIDCDELQKRFHHQKITRDSEGIIRHASRMQNSALPKDAISPIFLPHAKTRDQQQKIIASPRLRTERQSKTKALEIMKQFENSLEDTQDENVNVCVNSTHHSPCSLNRSYRKMTCNSLLILQAILLATVHAAAGHSTPNLKCYSGKVIIDPPKTTFKLISCAPPDFCTVSQKILSTSLLGNPHCWPVGALASLAIIVCVIALGVLIIFRMLKVLTRSKDQHSSTAKNKSGTVEPVEVEMKVIHSYRPTPLSGRIPLIACVLIMIISLGDSCQHGLSRHHTELVCNQDGKCSYEIGREILFNRLQRKHCIEIHLRNRTVGMLSIEVKAVHFTCVKTSKFFTKNTQHKIFYSHRCSGMGSCTASKCDLLQPNETSQNYVDRDLTQATRPVIIQVEEYFLDAFYRHHLAVAHIPITTDVYEVFECQDWSPSIHLEILGNIFGKTTEERYNILPYQATDVKIVNVTAVTVQMPSHSPMNKKFAQSESETVILPDSFQVPVVCRTRYDAQRKFSKCENRMTCSCSTGTSPHICECNKDSIGHIRSEDSNRLPLRDSVLTDSSELVIDDQCTAQVSELSGCYGCLHGARLKVSCSSHYKSVAELKCSNFTTIVKCSAENITTELNLNFNEALVEDSCYISCGNRSLKLPLEATCFTTRFQMIRYFSTIPRKDKPLLKIIRDHWKTAVLIAVTCTAVTGLVYLFGPIAIIIVFKILWAIIKCITAPCGALYTSARSVPSNA
ncbi:hypothetical protein OSTOST_00978, partial [Ostertagia ostertagi]